jgi:polyribonucleotide nucleotidyltransferase
VIRHKEIQLGGNTLSIETGRLAKQADGAVVVRYGDTVVLVTAVASKTPREGVDFLPLTVDYRENTYAAGKIPGGFFRREGRPNEKEVLTSRVIDRPLRPLFPSTWRYETQVIGLVLSSDQANDSDVLALTGASFALGISDIPFDTPIAAVRVGLTTAGEYLINPTFEQLETSRLNLVVAGSEEAVVMVEAGAPEVSESEMLEGIYLGHEAVRKIIAVQKELIQEIGPKRREVPVEEEPAGLREQLTSQWKEPLADAMRIRGKMDSYAKVDELKRAMMDAFDEDEAAKKTFAKRFWHEMQDTILREEVMNQGHRLDGRRFDEIRAVQCDVGVLPRTHGSALFTRGETQALVTVTLGTSADAQRLDWIEGESKRRFMLHYNFPPFSVGEARFLRGPGRREIGHGALGERSLLQVVPPEEKWPYTIRIVSDILESNGSSSMATVCGGSLALMDAGVPLTAPVAGIAMGLVKVGDRFEVLTDIAGAEDHHGDMDFKVSGTTEGITGLQMDIKITGIDREIMARALTQAREARMFLLDKMNGAVIGPGVKMRRSIQERTGCKVEIQDDGRVDIASTDEAAAHEAVRIIKELTAEAELGKTYVGKVVRVVNFGAFVEILPGVEGLLHISEIEDRRIGEVRDVLDEGDETMVKVIDIDAQGRVRLSRRAVLREQQGATDEPVGVGGDRGDEAQRNRDAGARRDRRPGGRRSR